MKNKLMYKTIVLLIVLCIFSACGSDDRDSDIQVDCATAEINLAAAASRYNSDPSSINCSAYRNALGTIINDCNGSEEYRAILESLGNCNNNSN